MGTLSIQDTRKIVQDVLEHSPKIAGRIGMNLEGEGPITRFTKVFVPELGSEDKKDVEAVEALIKKDTDLQTIKAQIEKELFIASLAAEIVKLIQVDKKKYSDYQYFLEEIQDFLKKVFREEQIFNLLFAKKDELFVLANDILSEFITLTTYRKEIKLDDFAAPLYKKLRSGGIAKSNQPLPVTPVGSPTVSPANSTKSFSSITFSPASPTKKSKKREVYIASGKNEFLKLERKPIDVNKLIESFSDDAKKLLGVMLTASTIGSVNADRKTNSDFLTGYMNAISTRYKNRSDLKSHAYIDADRIVNGPANDDGNALKNEYKLLKDISDYRIESSGFFRWTARQRKQQVIDINALIGKFIQSHDNPTPDSDFVLMQELRKLQKEIEKRARVERKEKTGQKIYNSVLWKKVDVYLSNKRNANKQKLDKFLSNPWAQEFHFDNKVLGNAQVFKFYFGDAPEYSYVQRVLEVKRDFHQRLLEGKYKAAFKYFQLKASDQNIQEEAYLTFCDFIDRYHVASVEDAKCLMALGLAVIKIMANSERTKPMVDEIKAKVLGFMKSDLSVTNFESLFSDPAVKEFSLFVKDDADIQAEFVIPTIREWLALKTIVSQSGEEIPISINLEKLQNLAELSFHVFGKNYPDTGVVYRLSHLLSRAVEVEADKQWKDFDAATQRIASIQQVLNALSLKISEVNKLVERYVVYAVNQWVDENNSKAQMLIDDIINDKRSCVINLGSQEFGNVSFVVEQLVVKLSRLSIGEEKYLNLLEYLNNISNIYLKISKETQDKLLSVSEKYFKYLLANNEHDQISKILARGYIIQCNNGKYGTQEQIKEWMVGYVKILGKPESKESQESFKQLLNAGWRIQYFIGAREELIKAFDSNEYSVQVARLEETVKKLIGQEAFEKVSEVETTKKLSVTVDLTNLLAPPKVDLSLNLQEEDYDPSQVNSSGRQVAAFDGDFMRELEEFMRLDPANFKYFIQTSRFANIQSVLAKIKVKEGENIVRPLSDIVSAFQAVLRVMQDRKEAGDDEKIQNLAGIIEFFRDIYGSLAEISLPSDHPRASIIGESTSGERKTRTPIDKELAKLGGTAILVAELFPKELSSVLQNRLKIGDLRSIDVLINHLIGLSDKDLIDFIVRGMQEVKGHFREALILIKNDTNRKLLLSRLQTVIGKLKDGLIAQKLDFNIEDERVVQIASLSKYSRDLQNSSGESVDNENIQKLSQLESILENINATKKLTEENKKHITQLVKELSITGESYFMLKTLELLIEHRRDLSSTRIFGDGDLNDFILGMFDAEDKKNAMQILHYHYLMAVFKSTRLSRTWDEAYRINDPNIKADHMKLVDQALKEFFNDAKAARLTPLQQTVLKEIISAKQNAPIGSYLYNLIVVLPELLTDGKVKKLIPIAEWEATTPQMPKRRDSTSRALGVLQKPSSDPNIDALGKSYMPPIQPPAQKEWNKRASVSGDTKHPSHTGHVVSKSDVKSDAKAHTLKAKEKESSEKKTNNGDDDMFPFEP